MATIESKNVPLGFHAPDFSLLEPLTGKILSLADLKSDKATLIMFICNHCPYVKHISEELVRIASDYLHRGLSIIAINSNDAEAYPDDSPEKMVEMATMHGFKFPYLFDKTQEVAKVFDAACTPDFYLFDRSMMLAYHGQLDDSRPSNSTPVTGKDLRQAIHAVLENKKVSDLQHPSIGCSIKWKKT